MIRTRRILGAFPVAEVILEPKEAAERFARRTNAVRVYVQSYEPLTLIGSYRLVRTKQTPIIALSGKTMDEVLATFGDTARNEIRRSFRESSLRFVTEDPARGAHNALYAAFERSQRRLPLPPRHFTGAILFGAYEGNDLIAGIACLPATPVLWVSAIYSARLSENGARNKSVGMATRRLVYEACAFGIKHGFARMDLAYVSDKEGREGINQFKTQFTRTLVPEYLYLKTSPFLMFAEKVAYAIRKIFLR